MKILLIGSAGMLGRAWADLLAREGIAHEAHDRDTLDLLDPVAVASALDRVRPTHVVNAAAWTDVDGAETAEDAAHELNARCVADLARLCAERGVCVVHYSTDYVFPGNADAPYAVDAPRAPLNAYGRTKGAGEEGIVASGADHLIVRTSWLYAGWGKNFVLSIARLCAERETLRVVDDQRGRPTSAVELAKNTLGLMRAGMSGIAHLTDDGECTWHGFATEIARLTGSGCEVEPCTSAEFPRPAPRPAFSVLDIEASRRTLGSIRPWREALAGALSDAGYDVGAGRSPEVTVRAGAGRDLLNETGGDPGANPGTRADGSGMSNEQKTVLVTGGSGFIGSNLIRMILEARPGWSVINLDALTYAGNPENLADIADHERYRFVHGSVNDGAMLDGLMPGVDLVMHLAAESHVDRSVLDATPFIVTNTQGTQCMLDATRRAMAETGRGIRFLYVSTDEVYGTLPLDDPGAMFTEETPIQPNSPYAASKAAGDLMCRAYHHTFGMDIVTTRCSNNLGPYQFPEKVIPLFVNNLLDGETVPLYGDGKNVRDWLHVEDHCEAMLAVLERGVAGEAYNVGGNNERSNLELTHALLELCGRGDDAIRYVEDRPGHDRRYAIDATKIERELGWVPTRSAWPDALERTVAWYRENRAWSDRIRSGAYREFYETLYGQRGAATPG